MLHSKPLCHRLDIQWNRQGYEEKPMVKVTVKDLYKSVSMGSVHHMLTKVYKLDVDFNDIKIGNCRDDQGNLSELINYDRYIYIHPDQLNAQCGTFKCRIYHKGQFGPSRKCFRCFREDHVSKNCTNPKACRVCLQFGHIPGSPDCRFYTTNTNTRPYGGAEDPLSNHYEGEFIHNHIKMKTVENGWFHQKALKMDRQHWLICVWMRNQLRRLNTCHKVSDALTIGMNSLLVMN